MTYILVLINVMLLVFGQILWKLGIERTCFHLTMNGLAKIAVNLYIAGGIAVYALATIIWLYILSKRDISTVYPMQSLCYVVALFAAWLIFKERLKLHHWLGVALIVFGAFVINI